MDKIKNNLKLQLNSIQKVENDPTIKKCTFSIIDFEESGNSQIISKELAQKYAYTLKSKALLCQYFKTTDYENQDDHFGEHGQYVGKDRYGNDTLKTDAIAVGCFEGEAYVKTVKDNNGFDKEALCCDAVLWYSRYPDVIDLMEEMVNENIDLYSSCEYWFYNYTVENGIQYVNEPLYFDGHCMLQSGENGTEAIPPAYKISKLQSFNKALEKIINEEDKQGGEKMAEKMFKKVCQLSFGQIESRIYTALSSILTEKEYDASWVTETYDDHMILSYRSSWDSGYDRKYYSVNYTKGENDLVTLDWENKKEVFLYKEWKEIPEVKQAMNALTEEKTILENSLNTKEKCIKGLNTEMETLKTENEKVSTKYTEATEKIVSLNSTVEEMKPIVDEYNTEKIEKSINEAKEKYQVKFDKIGASEKFNTVEVQELVKKSLNSLEAKNQLNDMIVDMVDNVNVTVKPIVEMAKSQNNLIHTESSFEDRFGFKL